jgi:pimeloyl-ACP methyl ester carboxylesterase
MERIGRGLPRSTVLCLHASASSPRQWDAIAAALAPAFDVQAPPLLGYEVRTPWPVERPLALDAEARALEPLLDRAPGPVHLLAHSYGAAVALQLALRRPMRVSSLTLWEPVRFGVLRSAAETAPLADEIETFGRRVGALAAEGRQHDAAALFVDYWSGAGAWASMPASRQEALATRMTKVRAEFEALFAEPATTAAFAALGLPVRLLRGDRSPEPARAVAARLAALLPRAELVELPAAGHMLPATHPDRLLKALPPWLTRPVAAASAAPPVPARSTLRLRPA